MFGQYLKEARRLMNIKRYQGKIMHNQRSVAEHSWFVEEIATGLALWENYKFKKHKVNMEKVWFMANKHDIIEAQTGDIQSPTKNISALFRQELVNGEKRIFENHVIKTLPNSWGQMYLDMHKELSELKTIEAKLVKAGDLIDRIFECMDEIKLGNTEDFEDIIVEDIEKLMKLELMSVEYFLKYSLKDIKGAYEYIPEDIKKYLEELDFSMYF